MRRSKPKKPENTAWVLPLSPEKFAAILAKQMPDAEKRAKAHFLVDTSRGFASAEAQLRSILASLAGRPGAVLANR